MIETTSMRPLIKSRTTEAAIDYLISTRANNEPKCFRNDNGTKDAHLGSDNINRRFLPQKKSGRKPTGKWDFSGRDSFVIIPVSVSEKLIPFKLRRCGWKLVSIGTRGNVALTGARCTMSLNKRVISGNAPFSLFLFCPILSTFCIARKRSLRGKARVAPFRARRSVDLGRDSRASTSQFADTANALGVDFSRAALAIRRDFQFDAGFWCACFRPRSWFVGTGTGQCEEVIGWQMTGHVAGELFILFLFNEWLNICINSFK